MKTYLTEIFNIMLAILISILFVIAGNTKSDAAIYFAEMMYIHLIMKTCLAQLSTKRRLKKYKKALANATELVRSTELDSER